MPLVFLVLGLKIIEKNMQSFSKSVSHQSDFTTFGLGRDHMLELKFTCMTAYYSFYKTYVF